MKSNWGYWICCDRINGWKYVEFGCVAFQLCPCCWYGPRCWYGLAVAWSPLGGQLFSAGYGEPSDAFELYGSKAKPDTGAKFCILTSEERARLEPECRQFFSTQTEANSKSVLIKTSVHMAFRNCAPLAFGPGTTVAKYLLQEVFNSEMKTTALQYWPAIMFLVFGHL